MVVYVNGVTYHCKAAKHINVINTLKVIDRHVCKFNILQQAMVEHHSVQPAKCTNGQANKLGRDLISRRS